MRFGAVTRSGDTVYCKREDEDQVVEVPKVVADALRRPWIDYVSRSILAQAVRPMRVDLLSQDREVRFRRDQGSWFNENRQVRLEGDEKLTLVEFLDEFQELRARAVVAEKAVEAAEVLTLRLKRSATDVFQEVEFRLVAPDGGGAKVFVALPDRPGVLYETSKGFRDGLMWLRKQG